jgi:hypothetical protein
MWEKPGGEMGFLVFFLLMSALWPSLSLPSQGLGHTMEVGSQILSG